MDDHVGLRHSAVSCAALIAMALASTAFAAAPAPLTIIDLGTLGGPTSRALDVNSGGDVVGVSTTAPSQTLLQAGTHAVLWEHGTLRMTDLGTLGGATSGTRAINVHGQIVGSSQLGGGPSAPEHAFLWEHGTMTDLGTLGGATSNGAAINDRGQITGYSTMTPGTVTGPGGQVATAAGTHAYLWDRGHMTDIGTLGGATSRANSINNQTQIVGRSQLAGGTTAPEHAFLWEHGTMTDLGTLPGGSNSVAIRINDRGQIIGASGTAPGKLAFDPGAHAVLWDHGRTTDLGMLAGFGSTLAGGLNNRGQVTGNASGGSGAGHGFFWDNGVLSDLNALIPGDGGWTVTFAPSINDQGTIAGGALRNGQEHAVLLQAAGSARLPATGVAGLPAHSVALVVLALVVLLLAGLTRQILHRTE